MKKLLGFLLFTALLAVPAGFGNLVQPVMPKARKSHVQQLYEAAYGAVSKGHIRDAEQFMAQLDTLPMPDTLRAKYLSFKGFLALKSHDMGLAYRYYWQGLNLFKKYNHAQGLARSYIALGALNGYVNFKKESDAFYAQAMQVMDSQKITDLAFDLQIALAERYLVSEQYHKAQQAYQVIVRLANTTAQQQFVRLKMGIAYYHNHQLEKAKMQFKMALAVHPEPSQHQGLAYQHLGLIATRQKQYTQALQHFDQAIAVLAKVGTKEMLLTLANNRAQVHQQLQQWAAGTQKLTQVLAVAEGEAARNTKVQAYAHLYAMYWHQQCMAQANASLQKQLSLLNQAPNLYESLQQINRNAVARSRQQIEQEQHLQMLARARQWAVGIALVVIVLGLLVGTRLYAASIRVLKIRRGLSDLTQYLGH